LSAARLGLPGYGLPRLALRRRLPPGPQVTLRLRLYRLTLPMPVVAFGLRLARLRLARVTRARLRLARVTRARLRLARVTRARLRLARVTRARLRLRWPLLAERATRLFGRSVPVGGRQRVRPDRAELPEPVLGRQLGLIVRPLAILPSPAHRIPSTPVFAQINRTPCPLDWHATERQPTGKGDMRAEGAATRLGSFVQLQHSSGQVLCDSPRGWTEGGKPRRDGQQMRRRLNV